jgi:TPR repeat protein
LTPELILKKHACGIMYELGEGTERDMKSAFSHYQKAAMLGIPPAAYNLGNLYASGNGVEQNLEKAFNCYAVASEAGDMPGKYLYATWLCEGRGCEKDVELGMKLQVAFLPVYFH